MNKINIHLYCLILLTSLLANCKDEDDNELSGTFPINIEELLVQETAQAGEEIEIQVYAVAPNGCFENLKITLRQSATNYYVFRATGYYDSNDTCPAVIVSLDTTINFTPPSAGTFYFQANEQPFPILRDTLTVL